MDAHGAMFRDSGLSAMFGSGLKREKVDPERIVSAFSLQISEAAFVAA